MSLRFKQHGISRSHGRHSIGDQMARIEAKALDCSRKINYSADVINYIENPSKWSAPEQIPGYALKSTLANNSGNALRGQFFANKVFRHWEFGHVAVSFSRPYIYPGHKCLYFPIRYLTDDHKLYREIAIFKVDHEPTQKDADNLYLFIIYLLELYETEIKEEDDWCMSLMLRPLLDALAIQVFERQTKERSNRLLAAISKGGKS